MQRITAECNGHALYCLRAALDYIEATPVDEIDIRGGISAKLTAHEKMQERGLADRASSRLYSASPSGRQFLESDQETSIVRRLRQRLDGCASGLPVAN